MSDEEWNVRQYRALIVFGLLFGVLLVYSLFDMVFLALGRDGTATVTDSYQSRSRRSTSTMVEYTFREPDGHERTGKANLGEVAEPPVGAEFEIQYLPRWLLNSPDASRPKRPFNWLVFGVFLAAAAGFGFFAWRAIYPPGEARPVSSRRRR